MRVTHAKTSAIADSGDSSLVQPSDWNADHVIEGGALPLQLSIRDGRYYSGPYDMINAALSFDDWDGNVVAVPIMFGETKTWTRIGVNCTISNAGTFARLGIAEDSGGLPGNLLLDAGNIEMSTTGALEITISQALQANTVYWRLCAFGGTAASITGMTTATTVNLAGWMLGRDAAVDQPQLCYGAAHVFGALPDPFTMEYAAQDAPYIWLRTGV